MFQASLQHKISLVQFLKNSQISWQKVISSQVLQFRYMCTCSRN